MTKKVKAALIIIGDEILSGRTKDANLNHIALWLGERGIILDDVRVIPDVGTRIVHSVNECRKLYDYVFTTGGIGPTHDDITAENVAKAFKVPLLLNDQAKALLEESMGTRNLSKARLRMAMIPQGASLIKNPVSGAPGFQIENLFVMAGIPVVMQSMLLDIENRLSGGAKILSKTLHVFEGESVFADILSSIENAHDNLTIGSYPFYKAGKYGASFVVRSSDEAMLEEVFAALKSEIKARGSSYFEGEAS